MIYDWSLGFTHQYFGVTLDYVGGAVPDVSNTEGAFMLLMQ